MADAPFCLNQLFRDQLSGWSNLAETIQRCDQLTPFQAARSCCLLVMVMQLVNTNLAHKSIYVKRFNLHAPLCCSISIWTHSANWWPAGGLHAPIAHFGRVSSEPWFIKKMISSHWLDESDSKFEDSSLTSISWLNIMEHSVRGTATLLTTFYCIL